MPFSSGNAVEENRSLVGCGFSNQYEPFRILADGNWRTSAIADRENETSPCSSRRRTLSAVMPVMRPTNVDPSFRRTACRLAVSAGLTESIGSRCADAGPARATVTSSRTSVRMEIRVSAPGSPSTSTRLGWKRNDPFLEGFRSVSFRETPSQPSAQGAFPTLNTK